MAISKKQIAFNAKVQSRIDAEVKAGRLRWDPQRSKYYNEATHRYTTVFNTKRLISYELRHPGAARYEAYGIGKAMEKPKKTPEGKRKVTTVGGKKKPLKQIQKRRQQRIYRTHKKMRKNLIEYAPSFDKSYKTDKRARDFFTVKLGLNVTRNNFDTMHGRCPAVFDLAIAPVIRGAARYKKEYYRSKKAVCSIHFHSKWTPVINPSSGAERDPAMGIKRTYDEEHDIDESTPFEYVTNIENIKRMSVEVMQRHMSYVMRYEGQNPLLQVRYAEVTIRPDSRDSRW